MLHSAGPGDTHRIDMTNDSLIGVEGTDKSMIGSCAKSFFKSIGKKFKEVLCTASEIVSCQDQPSNRGSEKHADSSI